MVAMRVGENVASRMVLDTAFPFTTVFSSYIDADPGDFTDQGGHRDASIPFADDTSYGLQASIWFAQVSHLQFGLADYQKFTVMAANFPFFDSADGLLGANYLQYYDLYFDYANQRLIIKPNAHFRQVFHQAP